jgi:hypothetical protein
MQWTPEQLERIGKARERGEDQVTLSSTKEQTVKWQKAVQEELASKEENSSHYQKIIHASKQSGFFADIRRAMMASRTPPPSWRITSESIKDCSLISVPRKQNSLRPYWTVCFGNLASV